jgi:hypothetical protein
MRSLYRRRRAVHLSSACYGAYINRHWLFGPAPAFLQMIGAALDAKARR